MRATVEFHEGSAEGFPPVKALVTLGKEDLSIKVSSEARANHGTGFHLLITLETNRGTPINLNT